MPSRAASVLLALLSRDDGNREADGTAEEYRWDWEFGRACREE